LERLDQFLRLERLDRLEQLEQVSIWMNVAEMARDLRGDLGRGIKNCTPEEMQ